METKLLAITNVANGGSTPVPFTDFPENLMIVTRVSNERVDDIGNSSTYLTSTFSNGFLNVGWGFPCTMANQVPISYRTIPRSVEYELEWTYVDDYRLDLTQPNPVASFHYDNGAIGYTFANNATRVRLKGMSYAIPVIYQRGAIIFRLRTVRPNPDNYEEMIYGNWSLATTGTVNLNDANFGQKAYRISAQQAHLGDRLNWQYSTNFAEEGKYKHSISYFDGVLKSRQSQTRMNSASCPGCSAGHPGLFNRSRSVNGI